MLSEELRMNWPIRFDRWYLASVCLLLSVGCGKPNVVTGTVTFQGNPLPAGSVAFACDGGKHPVIFSTISSTGGYEIKDAPVGRARVSVRTFKQDPPPPGIDPDTGREYAADWVDLGPYVPIPKKYGTPSTSGLEYTIVPGDQTFDIELKK
jgi:hypothetical protein